jgi:4-diphosphocytidyl-2-C-methyl-D-erythritol kinase
MAVTFPHCKINIGLYITGKRPDGFHNLETVFFPVPLYDVLEIVPQQEKATTLQVYGLPVAGKEEDNLCMKAYYLLKKDFPTLPAVSIHLLKNIPMGAGLGGGSANGAFMLQLLNDTFRLHLSTLQLLAYALQLGSDCPFFIHHQPCYATGRGEILTPVEINLSDYCLVLNNPGIHISTKPIFEQWQPNPNENLASPLQQSITTPVAQWKTMIVNQLETYVMQAHPSIAQLKEKFYACGAVYSAMSGSGSTVFGLFRKDSFMKENFTDNQYIFIG